MVAQSVEYRTTSSVSTENDADDGDGGDDDDDDDDDGSILPASVVVLGRPRGSIFTKSLYPHFAFTPSIEFFVNLSPLQTTVHTLC